MHLELITSLNKNKSEVAKPKKLITFSFSNSYVTDIIEHKHSSYGYSYKYPITKYPAEKMPSIFMVL